MTFRCTGRSNAPPALGWDTEPSFGSLLKADGFGSAGHVTSSGHIMPSHLERLSGRVVIAHWGFRGSRTENVHQARSHSVIREVSKAPRREEPLNHRR